MRNGVGIVEGIGGAARVRVRGHDEFVVSDGMFRDKIPGVNYVCVEVRNFGRIDTWDVEYANWCSIL
jgi:hypothetical protein